jgi:hypothetical protein
VPLLRHLTGDFLPLEACYEKDGEAALINSKPCPQNLKCCTPPHIEEKILHLRRTYHLGQRRIHWYLLRYHGILLFRPPPVTLKGECCAKTGVYPSREFKTGVAAA